MESGYVIAPIGVEGYGPIESQISSSGEQVEDKLFLGSANGVAQYIRFDMANRHGLIAGATGTGKTITAQNLAEGFARAGVPVFAPDMKGDLSGLLQAGSKAHKLHDKLQDRATKIGLSPYKYEGFDIQFWDLFGRKGVPVRTTIAEMGPVLLTQLLELNPTQDGALTIAFEVADEHGFLLLDMKDLRALLNFVGENRKEIALEYGYLSIASIGAIQRKLLVLERAGGKYFFGEPTLELQDIMRIDANNRGVINLLDATDLLQNPRIYASFLLWLLSELFETLPEIGDPDKPKLVFFFDEAHLLFDTAPHALLKKIEQMVKLIRSKGVAIFFITQNPQDIPDPVLAQLSNRIQHALRAYTPSERRAVRAAAQSFHSDGKMKVEKVITELGVGEALVSVLDQKAVPSIAAQTLIRPPLRRLALRKNKLVKWLFATIH